MRIIESRSIDNQAGLLGSRLITGTSTIEGAFQSFIVAEDTIVSKVYNSIGIDVTQKLGLTSVTLKAGAFISMPKGDYFSSIKLTSGSVVAYFVSHGGKTITADAYLNEFLARTGSSYLEAAECAKATLQSLINIGLLQKASLIMSPSMYQEDLVKSVVPQDGSGDLTFTRASNGTRINSAGLVEVVPWNLVQNSEDLSAGWTLAAATIGANATTAPNGTSTADSFTSSATLANHVAYQLVTGVSGAYTFSAYVKKANSQYVYLKLVGDASDWVAAVFDLNDGTLTKSEATGWTGLTASSESVGNGWYRLIVSGSGATSVNFNVGIQYTNTGTPTFSAYADASFTGTGTIDYYIWGAQLNIGSTAKPYFPTTDRLNVPRLTYQNGGGGCPSLLLEKQSTNLFPNSQTTASWSFTNMSRTANYGISPDGTQNADLLSPTTSGSVTFQSDITTSSLVIGQPFVVSFFIKLNASFTSDAGTNILDIRLSGPTVWSRPTVRVNLETGQVTSINNAIYISSTNFGNGWFRITFGATPTGTSGQVALQSPTSVTMNGGSFYIWGLQGEANATYATSYIPTTSSSATRVADACYKTGISSLIGQTEGTLYFELQRDNTDNDTRLQISDGSGLNWLFVSIETGLNPRAYCNVGGVNQFSVYGSPVSNSTHKVALAYKSNDFKVYIDGVAVITQTSGSVPACNRIDVGSGSPSGSVLSTSLIKEVILFKTRLTNAELASLTTI